MVPVSSPGTPGTACCDKCGSEVIELHRYTLAVGPELMFVTDLCVVCIAGLQKAVRAWFKDGYHYRQLRRERYP